jgi:general secretion pathway protein G
MRGSVCLESRTWAGVARTRRAGFSLVELIVALAILGVLAAAAVPSLQLAEQRERERELRTALREMRAAIDAYKRAADDGRIALKAGESGYPKNLQELVDGVDDKRSPTPKKLYFLRRIPHDPLSFDSAGSNIASAWGIRAYTSAADSPSDGEDVFDVFSRSTKVGLNGIAYREW